MASFASLAYSHSLRVSSAQVAADEAPDIGNLVGNDVVRAFFSFYVFSYFPGAAVQFTSGIAVLLYTIGWAGLVGLSAMLLLLVCNMRIARVCHWVEIKILLAQTSGWEL
jgi:hypothetical protein